MNYTHFVLCYSYTFLYFFRIKSLIWNLIQLFFWRVPKKKSPDYAHVQVVRKQAERQQLKAYVCKECEGVSWFIPQRANLNTYNFHPL